MAPKRIHPEPQVGDVHGCMTVIRILGRANFGRVRLVCKCECGYEAAMYEHNMYKAPFGRRCTHTPGSRKNMLVDSRVPHRIYEQIETLSHEERRVLFDRILDNFCCDTDTLDGRPCGEFADEECRHTGRVKAG